jgi:hypothetical protein
MVKRLSKHRRNDEGFRRQFDELIKADLEEYRTRRKVFG